MRTIPATFRHNGTDPVISQKPAYAEKSGGSWHQTTYQTYYQQCSQAARAMISLGFPAGGKISILAFNRPEWVIADLAAMMAGGVPAGIYQTCSPDEVAYIISHSESHIVFVENIEQWKKVSKTADRFEQLKWIVLMKGASLSASENEAPLADITLTWEQFLARAEETPATVVDDRIDSIDPEKAATFIYTSGTTGPPKAVMLSHNNLGFTAGAAVNLVALTSSDSMLSYLPLSHIAEQMFSIHGPISSACMVSFAESIEQVPQNLTEVHPTVIFGVPRIWEKIHAKIKAGLSEAPAIRQKIAGWAMRVGAAVTDRRNHGQEPSTSLQLQYNLANKLVFSKLKAKIGMDRARICVSGAAPIAPEVLQFLAGLDLVIHEVYGQSEGSGPTTFNMPGHTRFGTVGSLIDGIEVRIADDDEVLVKGKNIFLGYYKDPEATSATLSEDGWLHSGDLGAIDSEGFLKIIGRKKDIIITAGGKNIAPKNIEAALTNLPLVSQAVVIGDRRKYLSALIALDPEASAKWAESNGQSAESLNENSTLRAELEGQIEAQVNSLFARVEHIRKFTILPRELDLENGELTPTMKIKRRIVNENWEAVIDGMYE